MARWTLRILLAVFLTGLSWGVAAVILIGGENCDPGVSRLTCDPLLRDLARALFFIAPALCVIVVGAAIGAALKHWRAGDEDRGAA